MAQSSGVRCGETADPAIEASSQRPDLAFVRKEGIDALPTVDGAAVRALRVVDVDLDGMFDVVVLERAKLSIFGRGDFTRPWGQLATSPVPEGAVGMLAADLDREGAQAESGTVAARRQPGEARQSDLGTCQEADVDFVIFGSAGAVVYRNFHRQFVAFNAALAQYFRDLLIGEVIRGSQGIDQRPFGSQATIQRLGTDLRWGLDRATYGNLYSLAVEVGNYLKVVLDMLETPDIKKAFDANTKWDVIEFVSERYLGGQAEISQRVKMADAGRRLLEFIADEPFSSRDFNLFQAQVQPLGPVAEEWIAAYRMVPEGRSFPGITPALRAMLGVNAPPSAMAGR
jgi:hypothetical protein